MIFWAVASVSSEVFKGPQEPLLITIVSVIIVRPYASERPEVRFEMAGPIRVQSLSNHHKYNV